MDPVTPPVLDTADLTRRLRETEAELARVTLRLHRLENSTTVQLTRLVAAAVRNPRPGLPGLPRAVAGLLRRRRAARRPGATPAGSAAASPGPVGRGGPAGPPPRARGGAGPGGGARPGAPPR